jgi:retinol dehydrogenase-12
MNKNVLNQSFFIPKPALTEKTLPDQSNKVFTRAVHGNAIFPHQNHSPIKVFIVTGGYLGVGYELVKILYSKNGIVYIAGRNERKGADAIAHLKQEYPDTTGRVEFLQLDLSDLSTIKNSALDFMSKERRLDVLTNNAGIGTPPSGSIDAQNHELQLGTNCLGPFLFTQLLLPLLQKTTAVSPLGSVRVTWAGSLTTEVYAPRGGIVMAEDGTPVVPQDQKSNYGQSKVGNVFIASEFARRYGGDGIVSVVSLPS